MKNSLFSFATSELSQDAFICWLCNWMNHKEENPMLYELSQKFLRLLLQDSDIDFKDELYIYRQVGDRDNRIDVLLIIENKYVVILEDKTFTSDHGNQIQRYERLLSSADPVKGNFHIPVDLKPENVVTVYFKTGFNYHQDKETSAKVKIDGSTFFDLLNPYAQYSEIVENYCVHLESSLIWYESLKNVLENEKNFPEALCHQHGQYLLLEKIFPETFRRFYHGTSFGRPWSNCSVCEIHYRETINKSEKSHVYYRIDRKGSRYYISLRQYEDGYDKKVAEMVTRKKEVFYLLRDTFREAVKAIPELQAVLGGNNGTYKESEFGLFYLDGMNTYDNVVKILPLFNIQFLKKLRESDFRISVLGENQV